jgi:phosphatidylethanolamine/phosphatidyl-N-methylethanolamine N-methyltransferase
LLNSLRFLAEFVRHPSQTGAVSPSGRSLAKAIVKALGDVPPGQLVIELGPGLGSFTRALQRLLPDNPVLAIERNAHFVAQLRRKLPTVAVHEGCASDLSGALAAHGMQELPIAGVISGLPLLVLPQPLVRSIFHNLAAVLPAEAPFINFTYSQRSFRKVETPGYRIVKTRRVLLNVPPASVMTLRRDG